MVTTLGAKKKQGAKAAPCYSVDKLLEVEPDCELELPHLRVGLDVCYLTGVGADAVHAEIALRAAEAKHRMIKHVKCIHAELTLHPFGDRDVLHQRHIGTEVAWAMENVAPSVAEMTNTRIGECTT